MKDIIKGIALLRALALDWHSARELSEASGLSLRSVQRLLVELRRAGLPIEEAQKWQFRVYRTALEAAVLWTFGERRPNERVENNL